MIQGSEKTPGLEGRYPVTIWGRQEGVLPGTGVTLSEAHRARTPSAESEEYLITAVKNLTDLRTSVTVMYLGR